MAEPTDQAYCGLSIVDCRLDQVAASAGSIENRQSKIDNAPRGGLVFWILIVMGLGTFAPCILLPEWREFQAMRLAEQAEQHRLDAMRRVVEREKHLLEAMQSDPAVIGRVAQRDLHFYRPGDTTVAVDVPLMVPVGAAFASQPVEPPAVLVRASTYLPSFNYDAVFCDPRTRPIVMAMSVGLIGAAMALFWARSPRRNP